MSRASRSYSEAASNSRRVRSLAVFTAAQMARSWDNGGIQAGTTQRALAFAQYASAGLALGTMNRQAKIQVWSSWAADLKPNPAGFAGQTASGAPLGALLSSYGPAYQVLLGKGFTTSAASAAVRGNIQRDIANEVTQANYNSLYSGTLGARSVRGYKRILIGATNCSRCVVLAGARYYVEGFQRHPGCNCAHVPVNAEADASTDFNSATQVDGRRYYESLSPAGRLHVAGNSQANREALDAAAKSGTTDFNKTINQWTPNIPKAGSPGSPLAADQGVDKAGLYTLDMASVSRTGRAGRPTVKSTVMRDADNTADARRLLEERGFIAESPQLDTPTRLQIAGASRAL